MDAAQFAAHRVVWDTIEDYCAALGMLAGTPLGDAGEAGRFRERTALRAAAERFARSGFTIRGAEKGD